VKGRGGTILQPAIDLLERTRIPGGRPLLIITDGQCDRLRIRREHAFLLPEGRRLPFVPRGEVFRIGDAVREGKDDGTPADRPSDRSIQRDGT
jgi:predicted metal-dependent peptidase